MGVGGRGKKKDQNSQARLILEWDQPNGREVCRGAGEVLLLSEMDGLTLHHHLHVRRDKELLFDAL